MHADIRMHVDAQTNEEANACVLAGSRVGDDGHCCDHPSLRKCAAAGIPNDEASVAQLSHVLAHKGHTRYENAQVEFRQSPLDSLT